MNAATLTTEAVSAATEALARLESAWNAADGAAFGAVYAAGASFVTIRGERLTGAETIGAGHAGIFTTIYAGSVTKMELVHAEALGGDVVLAVSVNTLDCPSGPLTGVHQAVSTSVLTREAHGTWAIVSTHNTLVVG